MKIRVFVVLCLLAAGLSIPVEARQLSDKESREALEGNPQKYSNPLVTVVLSGSDKYAVIAWERLQKKQEWDFDDYRMILKYGRLSYSVRAWQRLQADAHVSVRTLCNILKDLPDDSPYLRPIYDRLESMEIPNNYLADLVFSTRAPYDGLLYERLLRQNPSVADLYEVGDGYMSSPYTTKAREEIWKRDLTVADLAVLVSHGGLPNRMGDQVKAWARLMVQGAPREAMVEIIVNYNRGFGPEAHYANYPDQAWEILLLHVPTDNELVRILASKGLSEELRQKVAAFASYRSK